VKEKETDSLVWGPGLSGVFEWDILNGKVTWDSSSVAMFGFSQTTLEHPYTAWWDQVVPEDKARIDGLFDAWKASDRKEEHWEYRFIRPDGEIRWIFSQGLLFRDEEGKPLRAIGTNQDITKLRQAEQSVLDRKQDFERIFDLLPAQIWYKDTQNRVLRVNDKVCKDLGMRREDIEGHASEEVFPLFAEKFFEADLEVITTGRPKLGIEERINTSNGDFLWIRTDKVPVKNGNGKIVGVLAISTDLTAQKRTEEYLRRDANRSRGLLELYEKAKDLTDDELYRFALQHAAQLTGSKIGFLHLVSDDQKTLEIKTWDGETLWSTSIAADSHPALQQETAWEGCVRLREPLVCNDCAGSIELPGCPVPILRLLSVPVMEGVRIVVGVANKGPEYDETDTIHIQLVANELQKVIHQQKANEALKQAKEAAEAANRAKDQFLAVLSHELRTPLTPVLATASDLQAQEALGEELRKDMDLIRRNVEMESKLIDDLLDMTRISQGKIDLHLEVVDIDTVLRTALEICQQEIDTRRLDISLDFQATAHYVLADTTRLRQVFWNLIKNAVEFTPRGGRIALRTSNVDDRLRIEVEDTGIGIRRELLPKIFNAFERGDQTTTPRFGGLGLGLNIAKTVVELHHGTIAVFSEGVGKGATFVVELPTAIPAEAPPLPPATEATQQGPKKILLVDDHPDTLLTLAKLLRRWGYAVVTANCVQAALELASKERFDLLVSDVGLADGSGLDIMQALKSDYALRGIAFSGYGTEDDIRRSRAAGFEEHLTKPVSAAALRTAVQRIASASA